MSDKFPHTEFSTLKNRTPRRFSCQEAELQKRAERSGYDIGGSALCGYCDAGLTQVDVDLGACTQCGCGLRRADEGDGLIEGGEE